MTKIEELKQKFQEKQKAFQDHLKEVFFECAKDIFNSRPDLESFGWVQYTPYFNDGEECVFRVYDDRISINGADEYNDEHGFFDSCREEVWSTEVGGRIPNESHNPKNQDLLDSICSLVESLDDNVAKAIFGDHVEVTIHKDGTVNTEGYDHD